jgi:hypothetical protein
LSFDKDKVEREEKANFKGNATLLKDSVQFMELDETPLEEDFISVPFRMISQTLVGKDSYKATDFSLTGVLEDAVSKLIGKPVYLDHSIGRVENAVGVVESAEWQDAFTDESGMQVSAGINGILKVDAKANPRIARALTNDKPFIFSCSVTVTFNWKPSHQIENFRWYVGEMGEDGKIICRQAVAILDFYEVSLVWAGADPFAKMLKNGSPYLIDWTSVASANEMPNPTTQIPPRTSIEETSNDAEHQSKETERLEFEQSDETETETIESLQNTLTEKCKEIESLQQSLTEIETVRQSLIEAGEALEQSKQSLASNEAKVTELNTQILDFATKLNDAFSQITSLKGEITERNQKIEKFVATKREECKRLYTLSANGKVQDDMLALIDSTDELALDVLLRSYGTSFNETMQSFCSCGKKVEFRTTEPEKTSSPKEKVAMKSSPSKFLGNKKR